jgi:hypothetical protein
MVLSKYEELKEPVHVEPEPEPAMIPVTVEPEESPSAASKKDPMQGNHQVLEIGLVVTTYFRILTT